MSLSDQLASVTVQAMLFSTMSTALAQSFTMYQEQKFFLDFSSFIRFIVIAIITTPPNYLYQKWLEDTFPARPSQPRIEKDAKKVPAEPQLSIFNTAAKFFLDQSISAALNTVAFLVLSSLLSGNSPAQTRAVVRSNFYSMLVTGWRVWPIVTLLNLVGNSAGLLWGVYLNLRAT